MNGHAESARVSPRRRRVAAALLIAVTAVIAPVVAVADDLDSKKESTEKKLDKAEAHADESSAELTAATAKLDLAEGQLALARQRLASTRSELASAETLDVSMQARLDSAKQKLAAAQADLDAGLADLSAQQDRLRRMVVSAYEQGEASLLGLSMVFTTQDPAALAGNLSAHDTVVDAQTTALDQLRAADVLLEVKRADTYEAKVEVAQARREAAANLVSKQALEQQAASVETQVGTLVELRTQIRDNAIQAKRADLRELKKLEAERDRIEALIAAQTTIGGEYTGVDGNGFLDFPTAGAQITSPFGYRIHPIHGYRSLHDGIDVGAPCGTPIRATADGVVLSEYFQTAYGNRIVIDHGLQFGVGLATISNHLESYAVAEGDIVERGDVIGYVGNTGWSTGCHLHFTVLTNGTATDPLIWF